MFGCSENTMQKLQGNIDWIYHRHCHIAMSSIKFKTYSPIFSKDPFLLTYSVIAPLNNVAYLAVKF